MQKERTRHCRLGREGENVSGERERVAWVLNQGQNLVGLNQHKVFFDIANGHINTEIILRQCK